MTRMKRLVKPATFLAVAAAVFSLNHFRSPPGAVSTTQVRAAGDSHDSEAAYRHRTCQPRHWRGMMLRQ